MPSEQTTDTTTTAWDALTPAERAVILSPSMRAAIYPGPGNPEYARGPVATMRALERVGIVKQVDAYSVRGSRGGPLTECGRLVRGALAQEAANV